MQMTRCCRHVAVAGVVALFALALAGTAAAARSAARLISPTTTSISSSKSSSVYGESVTFTATVY